MDLQQENDVLIRTLEQLNHLLRDQQKTITSLKDRVNNQQEQIRLLEEIIRLDQRRK